MKCFFGVALCFFLLSATAAQAQSKADEEAVGKLPQEFCDAWDKHDGHALARIMAEDVRQDADCDTWDGTGKLGAGTNSSDSRPTQELRSADDLIEHHDSGDHFDRRGYATAEVDVILQ